MHAQAKSTTAASPADLETFLTALSPVQDAEPINIEGVTGCEVEGEGLFHFAVQHGREGDAHERLGDYHPQWTTDLYSEEIGDGSNDPNQPGVLLGIIGRATASSQANGRAIDTVLIGAVTGEKGRFYVQVTFVGSTWSDDPPAPDPVTSPA